MAIHFSHSTRSLNQDRSMVGLIVIIGATGIVTAWLVWFFFAQIALYETSTQFTVRRDGILLAQFAEGALATVRPGQSAVFIPSVPDSELNRSIPARVMDTPDSTGRRDGLVHIYLNETISAVDMGGEIRIEVDRVSPFALLLRTRR